MEQRGGVPSAPLQKAMGVSVLFLRGQGGGRSTKRLSPCVGTKWLHVFRRAV